MKTEIHTPLNQWQCTQCNSVREKPVQWSNGHNPVGCSRVILCRECESKEWHNATMNEEKYEFVKAAQNNKYAEYKVTGSITLVTDWEHGGDFQPYAILEREFAEQEVDDILIEEIQDIISFEGIDIVEQNQLTFAQLEFAKLQEP